MTFGLKIIREMTKEELIEELIAGQRVLFAEQDTERLKHYVIQARTIFTQRRLIEEADLACNQGGPSGLFNIFNDEED